MKVVFWYFDGKLYLLALSDVVLVQLRQLHVHLRLT